MGTRARGISVGGLRFYVSAQTGDGNFLLPEVAAAPEKYHGPEGGRENHGTRMERSNSEGGWG